MTFKELDSRIVGSVNRRHWKQTKFGGWVHKDAEIIGNPKIYGIVRSGAVRDYAIIGETAKVEGAAQVYGDARIDGYAIVKGQAQIYSKAHIHGNARIQGCAVVSGEAQVYGEAYVYDCAHAYEDAHVYGEARLFGSARVRGNAHIFDRAHVVGDVVSGEWANSPLVIHASRWMVCHSGTNLITIGCNTGSFEWWIRHFDGLCNKHILTPQEKAEYGAHVQHIIKVVNQQT